MGCSADHMARSELTGAATDQHEDNGGHVEVGGVMQGGHVGPFAACVQLGPHAGREGKEQRRKRARKGRRSRRRGAEEGGRGGEGRYWRRKEEKKGRKTRR